MSGCYEWLHFRTLFEMQFPNEGIILFKRPELTSYLCSRQHRHRHVLQLLNHTCSCKRNWPPLIRLCESSAQFFSRLQMGTESMSTAPNKIWCKKAWDLFVAILHSGPDAFIKWLWSSCHTVILCSVYQHNGLMSSTQPLCCCLRSAEWSSRPPIILKMCKGSNSVNTS